MSFDELETRIRAANRAERDKSNTSLGPAKSKAVVTGAAGFIGSHVAGHVANVLDLDVVCVDDLSGGFERNVPTGCTFVRGDVSNATFVAELWQDYGPFAYVYHLAAFAAEGLSHFIRRFNYNNNLVASSLLLNAAVNNNASTFVFTSSIAAFGTADELPMREARTPQRPEDPYGIAKHAFELDLMAAQRMFGLDYVTFYPHNVYGPRQNIADKFRNAVGIFMNQLMRGEPMTVFGDGRQSRAFSYIDDVAPYISAAPFLPAARNQAFFVGTDAQTSVLRLTELVAKAMRLPHRVKWLPRRHEVVHAYAAHDKLRCVFNPRPPTPLPDGLLRTVEYSLQLGAFEPTGYADIEIDRMLPPSWARAIAAWNARNKSKSVIEAGTTAKLPRGTTGSGSGVGERDDVQPEIKMEL